MAKKSLAETHPEIAKQWHPTKNGDLMPSNVSFGSRKKVWWKCDKGDDHEWETLVSSRSSGKNCPICSNQKVVFSNSIASTNPELLKIWHHKKKSRFNCFHVHTWFRKKNLVEM